MRIPVYLPIEILFYSFVPQQSLAPASPTFTADRDWLHLETPYNDENFRTASVWAGCNFSGGKTWQFAVTP